MSSVRSVCLLVVGALLVCAACGGSSLRATSGTLTVAAQSSPVSQHAGVDLAPSNALAVTQNGVLYLVGNENTEVLRVTPNGTTTSIFVGADGPAPWITSGGPIPSGPLPARQFPLGGPSLGSEAIDGLATDAAGDLYIADAGENLLLRVTPQGMLTVVAGTGESGLGGLGAPVPGPARTMSLTPSGVAVDRQGDVFMGTGTQVVKITRAGILSVVAGNGHNGKPQPGPALDSPLDLVGQVGVDDAGDVYIGDGIGLQKVDPAGRLSVVAAASGNNTPGQALAVDPAGVVYYSPLSSLSRGHDSTPRPTIRRIGLDGKQTIVAGGVPESAFPSFPCPSNRCAVQPEWLAVGPHGDLYISQGDEHEVLKLTLP